MAASLSAGDGWVIQDYWSYWNCKGWTLQHSKSKEEVSFSHDADQGTWGVHIDWMTSEEKDHMAQALKEYLTLTQSVGCTTGAQQTANREDLLSHALAA